jgi:fumarylacetoacetase
MQAWEYQPLGPFLAKNFATSVSPWIVTRDVLEPFRIPGPARSPSDPEPLPYLQSKDRTGGWGFDIQLEVLLSTAKMRAAGTAPVRLSRGNLNQMFWTFPQMIAHHTSNGCNMMPGDLIASGTISGPDPESRGCMLELSWVGNGPDGKPLPRKPIALPTGETRTFLEDGDEVIMRGWCEKPGLRRIGFGECRGIIVPAK